MIKIHIRTETEAFVDDYIQEIIDILEGMILDLKECERFSFHKIYDTHGNHVGEVILTGKDVKKIST